MTALERFGMPPKERTILTPAEGWKPDTIYLVKVAWNKANPIHEAILQTGFISEEGEFAGYCRIWHNTYDYAENANEAHYLEVIKTLHQKGT